MTVRVYKSTDASAPVLTGQAGALLTVLDAVLVNGYGALAAAGWTKPFVNSGSIGIYRMVTTGGNSGFHLHVDDSGTNNTAKEAIICGAESASALSTLTGQFPTAAQLNLFVSTPTGGVVVRKSFSADATARPWVIVADGSCFYMFVETGDLTNPVMTLSFMFGDIFSYKSSDAYKCLIIGRNAANGSSTNNECFTGHNFTSAVDVCIQTLPAHFMARSFTGVGGSVICGKHFDVAKMGSAGNVSASGINNITNGSGGGGCTMGGNFQPQNFPYPNPTDGGLYLSPIWVHHSGAIRGYLKGLWAPLHHLPLNHGDTYSGTGTLSGKSFLAQTTCSSYNSTGSLPGQVHVETSDTWS